MNTLNHIKQLLETYVDALASIDSDDQQAYEQQVMALKRQLTGQLAAMRHLNPALLQLNIPDVMATDDVQDLVNCMLKRAEDTYSCVILPTGEFTHDVIADEHYFAPAYTIWQHSSNPRPNFVVPYRNNEKAAAQAALNLLTFNMLCQFSPGKLNFTIIDLNMSGLASGLTVGFDNALFHHSILMDEFETHRAIKSLRERMQTVMGKYGDLVQHNLRNKEIAIPYEVVILNDYPTRCDGLTADLMPLIENGAKCGIYFILMHQTDAPPLREDIPDVAKSTTFQQLSLMSPTKPGSNAWLHYTPLALHEQFIKAYQQEFNKKINQRQSIVVKNDDHSVLAHEDFEQNPSEISVTVGIDLDDKHKVTLRFNSGDYIHGFILGQSGSGKSVLLNNIISSAILKYSPEDLQLYLLDFKGVEFNRYRGVKHVKALLVDNSDPQMTLEVLRELKEENRRRTKLWRESGVTNIDGYNRKHPDSRLPQILFVADECQIMFKMSHSNQYAMAIQREIGEIVSTIATQGRSQGIHMLLATQQLDDTDISEQVLKNLTECFLLMCARTDSEKLVPDSSELTCIQPTGQACYFHKLELKSKLQSYFTPDEELAGVIDQARNKANDHKSNGEAYFNGSTIYYLSDTALHEACKVGHSNAVACIGRNIGIAGHFTTMTITPDYGENMLFFGANREEQTSSTALNALISLIAYNRMTNKECKVLVIDFLSEQQSKCERLLKELESRRLCRILSQDEIGNTLRMIAEDIQSGIAPHLLLVIFGHERFNDMRRNSPLINEQSAGDTFSIEGIEPLNFTDIEDLSVGDSSPTESTIKTFQQAFKIILDLGPKLGVHTLLQLDKPGNILFEGDYGNNELDKFRHRIMLRSENKYLQPMRLSEDIDVQSLSDEEERLRAYYYPDGGMPQLFTPFQLPDEQELFNKILLN